MSFRQLAGKREEEFMGSIDEHKGAGVSVAMRLAGCSNVV